MVAVTARDVAVAAVAALVVILFAARVPPSSNNNTSASHSSDSSSSDGSSSTSSTGPVPWWLKHQQQDVVAELARLGQGARPQPRVHPQYPFDASGLLYDASEHEFAMVSDLDKLSRTDDFAWRSMLKKGLLRRVQRPPVNTSQPAGLAPPPFSYEVVWGDTLELVTHTATRNRSMELSELVRFGHLLLGFCDYTGLVFKIDPVDGRVFQRMAVADGDGNEPKPCKMEWATVKDGVLWVGSMGLEWINADGSIEHHNAEWVKSIDANGRIENYNWRQRFLALRTAANCTAPGYLWHEAVHFEHRTRQWIILPRKASRSTLYSPKADERHGTNLLLVVSENFDNISVRRVGPQEDTYGFTSVRKLPGTRDLFMALKVAEYDDHTFTKLCVFDLDGRIYTDNTFVPVSETKYEGLEFI
eukprot:m.36765 g.36765  ORF g.36765 m.36765 type:complete len:416 (+) comp11460_c0_seq2:78-1325(+)